MTVVIVRPALPDDVPAILAFDHLAQQPETGREDFIRRSVEEKMCWVAVLENQVVGYGVLDYSFYACGFIAMLYVHKDYRRAGVGHTLLEKLEQICETPKLFTSTNLSNLPMQALLGKRGYAFSGVIYNLDEGDPELVFFKRVR